MVLLWLYVQLQSLVSRLPSLRREEGQTTAEYALVILAAGSRRRTGPDGAREDALPSRVHGPSRVPPPHRGSRVDRDRRVALVRRW